VPELLKIATGKEALNWTRSLRRSLIAGEDQEKAADQETLALLKRFSGNPDVEKAKR